MKLRVLGLMSGTSVDGIDACLVEIDTSELLKSEHLSLSNVKQVFFQTLDWSEQSRKEIFREFSASTTSMARVCNLHAKLGNDFADAALRAIQLAGFEPSDVDLIASHGQTLWHNPPQSTLQLGDPSFIAVRTGVTTVGDFRTADVACGGQGAPLTSTMDVCCLTPPSSAGWRAVQNIGGIGNVTLLPPANAVAAAPLSFDTGPGNVLIDFAAHEASEGRQAFDLGGALGRAGQICTPVLREMLQLGYFGQPPPKTTGRELYTKQFYQKWRDRCLGYGATRLDVVATFTELTAQSIAIAYKRWCPGPVPQVVVGGGGARNPFLMDRLAMALRRLEVGDLGFSATGSPSSPSRARSPSPSPDPASPPHVTPSGHSIVSRRSPQNVSPSDRSPRSSQPAATAPPPKPTRPRGPVPEWLRDLYICNATLAPDSPMDHGDSASIEAEGTAAVGQRVAAAADGIVHGDSVRAAWMRDTLVADVAATGTADRRQAVELVSHEVGGIGLDSDAKEAVAFALLGVLAVLGKTGNVPSCTGAREGVQLGKICPGKNFMELMRKCVGALAQ